jgi:hypothetical protein
MLKTLLLLFAILAPSDTVWEGGGLRLNPFKQRSYPSCPGGICPNGPSTPFPSLLTPIEIEPEDSDGLDPNDVILKEYRPRNQYGQCVWCSLESVFASAGYDQFRDYGIRAAKEGFAGATVTQAIRALDAANVPYMVEQNGSMEIFREAKRNGVGVTVFGQGHCIAVAKMSGNRVWIVDNNDNREVQVWSKQRFSQWWSGNAVAPKKNKRKDKEKDRKGIIPRDKEGHPFPNIPLPRKAPQDGMKPTPVPDERPTIPGVDLSPLEKRVVVLESVLDKLVGNVERVTIAIDKIQRTPGPAGKDGVNGKDGRDGKDTDPQALTLLQNRVNQLQSTIEGIVHKEPISGRDGKDGKDGKDADVKPLLDRIAKLEAAQADYLTVNQLDETGKVIWTGKARLGDTLNLSYVPKK